MAEAAAAQSVSEQAREVAESVRIQRFHENVAERWDDFVRAQPRGTFFHQAGWKRVVEKTFGYQPCYFYAERGGSMSGVAPVFSISNWIVGHCLISVPFAAYGGVCAADAESEQALLSHLTQLATARQVEYLELRNRDGGLLDGFHRNPRYATFTMPLHADPPAIFASLPKDIRYMIRKGEKAGLQVRRGFDQLDDFYRLFALNMQRHGTPVFSQRYLENLLEEFPKQIDLMLVYSNARPVAGAMSFLFRDTMQPYYVGAAPEARTLAANDFMWWELIQYAAITGKRCFDFGRSKKDTGSYAFKKKWKPEIESLDYQAYLVRRKSVPNFSPANRKFEWATQVWKRMPLGLTRLFGPHVVRWFP